MVHDQVVERIDLIFNKKSQVIGTCIIMNFLK